MGKGRIVGGGEGGLYLVELMYNRDRLDSDRERIERRTEEADATISSVSQDMSEDQAHVYGLIDQINEALRAGEDSSDLFRELGFAQIKLQGIHARLSSLQAQRAALLSRQNEIASVPENPVSEAWCADYTDDLPPGTDVGTIDMPGEGDSRVIIRPAFEGAAAYDASRDGQLTHRIGCSPAQAFVNAALLSGWQKWEFPFRVGTIKNVDSDIATVEIDREVSSAGGLQVQPPMTISGVPIEYMDCNGAAFEEGDRVVIEYRGNDREPVVIGFESEPRECAHNVLFSRHERYEVDGSTYHGTSIFDIHPRDGVVKVTRMVDPAPTRRVLNIRETHYSITNWNEEGDSRGAIIGIDYLNRFPLRNEVGGKYYGICPRVQGGEIFDVRPETDGVWILDYSLNLKREIPIPGAHYWFELWVDSKVIAVSGWLGSRYGCVIVDRETGLQSASFNLIQSPVNMTGSRDFIGVAHRQDGTNTHQLSLFRRDTGEHAGSMLFGENTASFGDFAIELSGRNVFYANKDTQEILQYRFDPETMGKQFIKSIPFTRLDHGEVQYEEVYSARKYTSSAASSQILSAHNQIRSEMGLEPLSFDSSLSAAAMEHAKWMASVDSISHTGSGGSTIMDRAEAAGFAGVAVGENLAAGQREIDEVMDGWMGSPGHRANIVDPDWTQAGAAMFKRDGGNYEYFWCVVFGR